MKDTDNFEHGYFEQQTIDAYLNHLRFNQDKSSELGQVYAKDSVAYFLPRTLLKEIAPNRMPTHTVASNPRVIRLVEHTVGSLLYMDVGRWGGSARTDMNTSAAWGRRRDFGLVCGRTAALCSYQGKNKSEKNKDVDIPPDNVSETVQKTAGFKQMRALLDHLSTDSALGRVTVTKALACYRPETEVPDWNTIHVFLGDIHAPIVKNPKDTLTGAKMTDFYGDPLPRGDVKVPSWNRLDLTEVKKAALKIAALTGLSAATRSVAVLAAFADDVLKELAEDERIVHSPKNAEPMSMDEAEEWFELYSGKPGGKGADIFEEADADLDRWIGLLQQFQRSSTPRLRFVQTGDLFDYWIGLKVGFKDRFDNVPYQEAVNSSVKDWFSQACYLNKGIERMFRYIDSGVEYDKSFKPVYLYGNHDNYLSAMRQMGYDIQATFETTGLRAEHGHYSDTFNHDENPSRGWMLTQIAYVLPSVRDLEDPLSAYLAQTKGWIEARTKNDIKSTEGPRLAAMEYAASRCFVERLQQGKKPLAVFVQGHSHEPVLKEIRFVESRRS